MPKTASRNEYYLGNPNIPNKNWKGEYTKEMVKDLEKAKANLLYFAEKFFYIIDPDRGKVCIELFPYQKRILRTLRDNRKVILLASRQCGKALDVSTPIKTPTGWITMGELKDGDQVYGLNGNPCNVVKAHDIMHDRVCYEVEFDNGEKIVADAEHNWFTQTRAERAKGLSGSVKTTEDILHSLNTSQSEPNHRIPACKSQTGRVVDTIKCISLVESRPVRCITVDSEDSLYLCGRSLITTHNTTCLTIYALWIACFLDYQNIVIVANKESTAMEIFRRVRLAYEEIPNWLKPGVKEYAKTSCEFDNGSRISISTTTGSAARGQSINCVTGDTYLTIRSKVTGEIQTITMAEFENVIVPGEEIITESSGLDMINHKTISNIEFEVLTDEGFKSFEGLIIGENIKKLRIEFSNGSLLKCTPEQKIFLSVDKTIHAKELQVDDTVYGNLKVVSVHHYEDVEKVYDLLEVEDNHRYYANDILVHQCLLLDECAFIEPESILEDFWRSVFPTLSRSKKSKVLIASTPNGTGNLFHKLYEGSEKDENGFVTEIVPWYDIPGRDEKWKQEQLAALGSVESFLQEYECVHGNTLVDVNIGSEYNQTTIAELYSLLMVIV
jgi:intein/homing endonuclease